MGTRTIFPAIHDTLYVVERENCIPQVLAVSCTYTDPALYAHDDIAIRDAFDKIAKNNFLAFAARHRSDDDDDRPTVLNVVTSAVSDFRRVLSSLSVYPAYVRHQLIGATKCYACMYGAGPVHDCRRPNAFDASRVFPKYTEAPRGVTIVAIDGAHHLYTRRPSIIDVDDSDDRQ